MNWVNTDDYNIIHSYWSTCLQKTKFCLLDLISGEVLGSVAPAVPIFGSAFGRPYEI